MTYDRDRMLERAQAALLTVGTGRGFVVETLQERLVVTSAQCLPHLSRPDPASDFRGCTFFDLLGPFGADTRVSTECLFVDSVSDVAVLGEPKSLVDADKNAYGALVNASGTLEIGVVTRPCDAWLLSLAGQWKECRVRTLPFARSLTVVGADEGIAAGTSGSPILSAEGQATGIVTVGNHASREAMSEQHGQPLLASVLPVWLFNALTTHRRPQQENEL